MLLTRLCRCSAAAGAGYCYSVCCRSALACLVLLSTVANLPDANAASTMERLLPTALYHLTLALGFANPPQVAFSKDFHLQEYGAVHPLLTNFLAIQDDCAFYRSACCRSTASLPLIIALVAPAKDKSACQMSPYVEGSGLNATLRAIWLK